MGHYEQWLDEFLHKKMLAKIERKLNPKKPKPELFKDIICKTIRGYLSEHGYRYLEINAQSGSIYFQISIPESDWQTPVIRISDHYSKRSKIHLAEFIIPEISKNRKKDNLQKYVIKQLNVGFKKLKKSALHKAWEAVREVN